MKLDNTLLIGGVIVLVGVFVFKDKICEMTNGTIPVLCDIGGSSEMMQSHIESILSPKQGSQMSPEQEADQAAMYADYY